MTEDEATKAKAQRAIILLYVIMAVFVLLPFVIYVLRRR
jgi:hypothetical protein